MSDSVRPLRRKPTRLPRLWDSPGKNTGVCCHFLLQRMKVKSESEVAQSCPTQRPHGLQPTRPLCPWDFPGKSTGVGCHRLLWFCGLLYCKQLFLSLFCNLHKNIPIVYIRNNPICFLSPQYFSSFPIFCSPAPQKNNLRKVKYQVKPKSLYGLLY